MNSIVLFMVSPYDFDHESKIKVGTVQQNNNMIDGVNLRAEAKQFTHRRCKVLTQCQFSKRGVGASP